MAKNRLALIGSAVIGAALLCGAGAAKAQGYYGDPGYYGRDYDEPTETVIVRPHYDQIEEQQLLGRIGGEVNPQAYRISRPVSFSDLDLSQIGDRAELRGRVHDTAVDLCAELDARVPGLSGDRDADRECVRNATRNAMLEIRDRFG